MPKDPPTLLSSGTWTIVLEECRTRTRIQDFLQNQIDEESFVVVHIDTAEAHLPGYDITRPDRDHTDYGEALRALIVEKLARLLGPKLNPGMRYAIAIEETDAWVLTIVDQQDKRDTCARPDPKKRLRYLTERKAKGSKGKTQERNGYEHYQELTRDFRNAKKLEACAVRNRSLRLFIDSLTPPAA